MYKPSKYFYAVLLGFFPLFFLLHWNGMLSITYYWALEAVNGTRSILPQIAFSFISAVIIFSVIAILFEFVLKMINLVNAK